MPECVPQGKEPFFPYWRVFEKRTSGAHAEPRLVGVRGVRSVGAEDRYALARPVLLRVQLKQLAAHRCPGSSRRGRGLHDAGKDHHRQSGRDRVHPVHVTLSKVIKKVLFVDVFGRKPESGEAVTERMSR